ncbi:hypothetical protein EME01_56470 [Sinorhizobium meliloti]|nr:hypothetical protein EME01_56470 [Sinorhizobium meliloti]
MIGNLPWLCMSPDTRSLAACHSGNTRGAAFRSAVRCLLTSAIQREAKLWGGVTATGAGDACLVSIPGLVSIQ